MSDPTRLLDSSEPHVQRLLESAATDAPKPRAARATLVALGLSAPAMAAGSASVVAGGVLKGLAVKVVVALAAAAVAGSVVVAVAPKPQPRRVAVHPVEASKQRPAPVAVETPAPLKSTFAAESALLRAAAEAGDPGTALALLAEHEAKFPNALLAEEAAALRVEALAASGDRAAAKAALHDFEAKFPDSAFAPVINRAPRGDVSPQQAERGDPK